MASWVHHLQKRISIHSTNFKYVLVLIPEIQVKTVTPQNTQKLTAFSRFTVNCLRILSNTISSVFGWSWIITWPHAHSHTDTTGFSTGSPRWPLAPVSVDCKIETGDWIKTIFQVTHQGYTKMSYELRISACHFHNKTPLKNEILNENIARKHRFFCHGSNTYLRSPCLEQRLPTTNKTDAEQLLTRTIILHLTWFSFSIRTEQGAISAAKLRSWVWACAPSRHDSRSTSFVAYSPVCPLGVITINWW